MEVEFNFNGIKTVLHCNINDKMKNIFEEYTLKIGKKIELLYMIYDSNIINEELMEKTYYQTANNIDKKRKIMNILVYLKNSKLS